MLCTAHHSPSILLTVMPPAADLFSTLSEPLLGLILSKIPIKEAVRCSILSKRWRFIYTQIPQLTLSPYQLVGSVNPDPEPFLVAMVENIISNLLLLHSLDLEAFHLCNYISKRDRYKKSNKWQFSRQSVWKWVRFAACRNVQHLTLRTSPFRQREETPPALFSCTRLITLKLFNCILTHTPTHFSGFNHLVTCNFTNMELTDDSISCFNHRPFLRKLTISNSIGLRKPVVSAPNLIHLVMRVKVDVKILTVNCPRLRTLDVYKIQYLKVNGVLFHEISHGVRHLEMQWGNSMTVIRLRWEGAEYNISTERFFEIVGTFKALKELCIPDWSMVEGEKDIVVLIHKLLQTLPHLEILDMPDKFIWEMHRDPVPSCLNSPLGNVRIIKADMLTYDKRQVPVLSSFLEVASGLEIMELNLDGSVDEMLALLTTLLNVRRASTRARIKLVDYFRYAVFPF